MLIPSINTEITLEIVNIEFGITIREETIFYKVIEYIKNITLTHGEWGKCLKESAYLKGLISFGL